MMMLLHDLSGMKDMVWQTFFLFLGNNTQCLYCIDFTVYLLSKDRVSAKPRSHDMNDNDHLNIPNLVSQKQPL